MFQKADKEGILGVTLNKDIVKVAAKALEKNLTLLGPKVLPYSEQLAFAHDYVLRRLGWREGKPYQPKFRKAFEHFCIHAGRKSLESLHGITSFLLLPELPMISQLFSDLQTCLHSNLEMGTPLIWTPKKVQHLRVSGIGYLKAWGKILNLLIRRWEGCY